MGQAPGAQNLAKPSAEFETPLPENIRCRAKLSSPNWRARFLHVNGSARSLLSLQSPTAEAWVLCAMVRQHEVKTRVLCIVLVRPDGVVGTD